MGEVRGAGQAPPAVAKPAQGSGQRTSPRRNPWRSACKPSSVPAPGGAATAIHLSDLPEGWASHLLRRERRLAPSYSVLLRLELAAFHSRLRGHRHCGAGPRLTADGRYPRTCSMELGLSSNAAFRPLRPRPSGRLQGRHCIRFEHPFDHPFTSAAGQLLAAVHEHRSADARAVSPLPAVPRCPLLRSQPRGLAGTPHIVEIPGERPVSRVLCRRPGAPRRPSI